MADSNPTLRITNNAREGYRRAGVVFVRGINTVAASSFTEDQLAALEADPHLDVAVAGEAEPAEAGQTPGPVDDPLVKGMERLLELVAAGELQLNSSGKPDTKALSLSAAQRDQVWSDYQAQQQEQDAE